MVRLLTFIFFVIVAASLLTALLAIDSRASIEAFGWRFDVPTGVAAFLVAAFTTLVVLFASFIKDLADAPKRARARAAFKRRERGLAALTQGFNAAAAGDAQGTRKQAALALKALGDAPAAKILSAEAARLSGDDAAAEAALADLVDAPETAFLALRALLDKARAAGDDEAARRYAERAFAMRPAAVWAFDAVFDLALRGGDFGATRDALARALKSGAIDRASGERALAATFAALAARAHASGADAAALVDADASLKLAPTTAPAALLSARLHAAAGDRKRSAKILHTAYSGTGSSAIAEAFEAHVAGEPASARADALEHFAGLSPDAAASPLLRARAALLRGEAAAAVAQLEDALEASASAPALALMAEAKSALRDEAAANGYFERAARAPRPPEPRGDDYFAQDDAGWAAFIRAARAGARPKIDPAPAAGLQANDFALLAPPPLKLAPPADDAIATDEILERDVAAARSAN